MSVSYYFRLYRFWTWGTFDCNYSQVPVCTLIRYYHPKFGYCFSEHPINDPSYSVATTDNALTLVDLQRAAWIRLHELYKFQRDCDVAAFNEWLLSVPFSGCDCEKDWAEHLKNTPPDFSSPDRFFAWSVNAHNAVNKRLGKPTMTLRKARTLYDRSLPKTPLEPS